MEFYGESQNSCDTQRGSHNTLCICPCSVELTTFIVIMIHSRNKEKRFTA